MTDQVDNITDPAFGAFALPTPREMLRKRADRYGDTRLGRWAISYFRKRAFRNLNDPFDVEILPGVNTRLWPRTSRCEKRAFAGQQIWDKSERDALLSALDVTTRKSFVFLDVGANVGLYSLILAAHAEATKRKVRIFAIEPDETNRSRLEFNIRASEADIKVLPLAVSDQPGMGHMAGGDRNRGEAKLSDTVNDASAVKIETLYRICKSRKLTYIDAMKLDIEGHDFRAVSAFFKQAPKILWPRLLIAETGRAPTTPLLELCTTHGYTITQRTGINAILERQI